MEVLGTPPALLFHTHSSERQQSTAELFLDELLHRKRRLHREIEVYAVHGWICFLLLTSALPEGSQQPALSPSVRWRSGVLTAGPQAPSPAKLSSRAAPPGQPLILRGLSRGARTAPCSPSGAGSRPRHADRRLMKGPFSAGMEACRT